MNFVRNVSIANAICQESIMKTAEKKKEMKQGSLHKTKVLLFLSTLNRKCILDC